VARVWYTVAPVEEADGRTSGGCQSPQPWRTARGLLSTKLYVPPPRIGLVLRPRMTERLTEVLHLGHKLVLISAPAGFGKTTLLSEWVSDSGLTQKSQIRNLEPKVHIRVAWLSLDEADNDPARFFTYLIGACRRSTRPSGQGCWAPSKHRNPPHGVLAGSIVQRSGR